MEGGVYATSIDECVCVCVYAFERERERGVVWEKQTMCFYAVIHICQSKGIAAEQ